MVLSLLFAGVMPKRGCNPHKCEIMRFYKVHAAKNVVEPISMIVPRKVTLKLHVFVKGRIEKYLLECNCQNEAVTHIKKYKNHLQEWYCQNVAVTHIKISAGMVLPK